MASPVLSYRFSLAQGFDVADWPGETNLCFAVALIEGFSAADRFDVAASKESEGQVGSLA